MKILYKLNIYLKYTICLTYNDNNLVNYMQLSSLHTIILFRLCIFYK